ncbi:hypothetical protein J7K07_06975 [Candidatus Bathyarchaeota archaeon]|nr:hypothetical protein [Candidatus Bathyarchaeota archaeon]
MWFLSIASVEILIKIQINFIKKVLFPIKDAKQNRRLLEVFSRMMNGIMKNGLRHRIVNSKF